MNQSEISSGGRRSHEDSAALDLGLLEIAYVGRFKQELIKPAVEERVTSESP